MANAEVSENERPARTRAAGSSVRVVRDKDMRDAVARHIITSHATIEHLLVEEVDVRDEGRRMDLMLVADELTAFELKSDGDSLRRLRPQAEAFSLVADRAVVVVGDRYVGTVTNHVPAWWGVWRVATSRAGVRVNIVRRGSRNQDVSPDALAGLLLHGELIEELRWHGIRGVSRLGVAELRRLVVEVANAEELAGDVREHLRRRTSWRRRALSQYLAPTPLSTMPVLVAS